MHIAKKTLGNLPKVAEDPDKMIMMDYVQDVLKGAKKPEAFNRHFPDMYNTAVDNGDGDRMRIKSNINRAITRLEAKPAMRQMFELAHKNAWTNFLGRKHQLYDNLFEMALNEDNSVRDRISASKTMLDHMPKFEEDKTITVEVKDTREDFVKGLRDMQLALHKQANKDIEDAEVIDA